MKRTRNLIMLLIMINVFIDGCATLFINPNIAITLMTLHLLTLVGGIYIGQRLQESETYETKN